MPQLKNSNTWVISLRTRKTSDPSKRHGCTYSRLMFSINKTTSLNLVAERFCCKEATDCKWLNHHTLIFKPTKNARLWAGTIYTWTRRHHSLRNRESLFTGLGHRFAKDVLCVSCVFIREDRGAPVQRSETKRTTAVRIDAASSQSHSF